MRRIAAALLALALPTGVQVAKARAERPAPTIELGWRWALAPTSDDGVRLLDSLELSSLVPVVGSFALQPSVSYGVSYGTPWYSLVGFGAEALYAPRGPHVVPRIGGGIAGQFEAIVREGADVHRASRRGDWMVVARGGVSFERHRRIFGIDLRVAVAPMDRLRISGPVDIGVSFRGGFVALRRR